MTKTVISVENLSKQYDLGVVGTGTIARDLERWWAKVRGKPDPYSRIGQKDAFELIGKSILALDDVSFAVNQGEALGIIGRNGAGKSTLLKILSRVTAPTSGLVKVKGRIGSLLEVGTGFHPELTGRENVYLNGAILGMKKTEVTRKFDEIVDFSGVEKFIDTPVKRYSSGMYVRLAFAVAAHLDPEILIVDEVLAVGDAEFQKKCLRKMGTVADEGNTVLFVSHNMGTIGELCNSAIYLNDGSIETQGKTMDVIDHYLQSDIVNKKKIFADEVINIDHQGPASIVSVWLEDSEGNECFHYKYSQTITFCMEVAHIEDNAIVGISVRDAQGHIVVHLSNIDERFILESKSKNQIIRVLLDRIILRDGDYSVTFWLGDKLNRRSDRWEDVIYFHVDETHLGRKISKAQVHFPASWSVE